MSTATTLSPATAARFHALADEWRAATRFLAAPSAAAEHPAYRAIVDLGPSVVPLILADLSTSPEPWFAALRELTGADPVPPGDRGRPRASAEHWLAWGRARAGMTHAVPRLARRVPGPGPGRTHSDRTAGYYVQAGRTYTG